MKSRSMKKFMRKAVSAVSAVAMAIMLAAPAVSTQAFAADGKAQRVMITQTTVPVFRSVRTVTWQSEPKALVVN